MYTEEQYHRALEVYEETKSVTKTIQRLGYPSRRQTLYNWINRKRLLPEEKSTFRGLNTAEHPRHPSLDLKLEALHRCFELGEDVQSVSQEIGYSTASIYTWRKKFTQKGRVALMNSPKEHVRGVLPEGKSALITEIDDLKSQMHEMEMEIDILKETINILKKDPGVDRTALRNKEKVAIIDALKSKYSLPKLCQKLNLPKSSYYYQELVLKSEDKYEKLRRHITELFRDNYDAFGYRRIHTLLQQEGTIVSKKVILRIMKSEKLIVKQKRERSYNSYKGEISPAAENLIKRDFHADKPNQKWLTDITEFSIRAGKVYLSPMIDCFDGMPFIWTIGTSPNAHLVNNMLTEAIATLNPGEKPIIHSDRGCHYRWPKYISIIENAGLIRSMSKKGCSPDNSACEGFFLHLKTELFYNRSWDEYTIDEFIQVVNDYIEWYCRDRIKISLGGLSPLDYRRKMGVGV